MNKSEKKYQFAFSGYEISVIKAAMQLYQLNQDFGVEYFLAIGGCWGSSENRRLHEADRIQNVLNNKCKIKPYFNWGVSLKTLDKILKSEIKDTQKYMKEKEKDTLINNLKMEINDLKIILYQIGRIGDRNGFK